MTLLNVAVVGVGGMGRTHLENLRIMPDVRIVAICDPSSSSMNLAHELSASLYTDLATMLTNTQIDVVIVCTPSYLHAVHVEACLLAGKHCICEKPLCLSYLDGLRLYDLADRMGLYLYVGQVVRFFDEYELAAKIIQSNEYGRLIDAYLYRLSEQPQWQKSNWLFNKEKSGLIPYDLHIHDLDFLISLLGKPAISAVQSGPQNDSSHRHYYRIFYQFKDITACCEASWYQSPIPFSQGYRFYFENALLTYDGSICMLYVNGQEPHQFSKTNTQRDTKTYINLSSSDAFYKEIGHFLSCIKSDTLSTKVTKEQALTVLETLDDLLSNNNE